MIGRYRMSSAYSYLKSLLEEASHSLQDVTWKRMFGCDAAFAKGHIYGLIWKTGRIGLRFPTKELFSQALALDGAEPWTIGEKTMSHWVLMPETFHDQEERLTFWVQKAHQLACAQPAKIQKNRG